MKYRHWFHTKHMKKREEKKEWYVEGKDLHRGQVRKHLGGENHKCSPCIAPWSTYNDRMVPHSPIPWSFRKRTTEEIHWFCSASRVYEPTSGASRHLLPEEGGKNLSFIIVMEPAKPPEPTLFSDLFHIRFHIFGEVSGDGAVDDAARDDDGVDLLGFGCFFYSGLEVVLNRFHDFIFLLGFPRKGRINF